MIKTVTDRIGSGLRTVCRLLVLIPGLTLSSGVVGAQSLRIVAPERAVAGQELALYVDWEASAAFEGGVFELPLGWELEEVQLLDARGNRTGVRVRPTNAPAETAFSVLPSNPAPGRRTVMLRVLAARASGSAALSFTPFRSEGASRETVVLNPDEAGRVRQALMLTDPIRSENQSLQFPGGTDVSTVVLDPAKLPDLSASDAFTIEAWLRTAKVDQIVVSTWDGNEENPYALEAVVDRAGYLVTYQGMPGDHRAMRSSMRVADGTWHHIAVVYDPERAWSRLVVDGVPSDSLHHAIPLATRRPSGLALGGRPLPDRSSALFAGELDEVRVWAVARTAAMIRSTLFRSLPQPAAAARFFSFDFPVPREFVLPISGKIRSGETSLSFRGPLADVSVAMTDAGVNLGWHLVVSSKDRFQVERSGDGRQYEVVGLVGPAQGTPLGNGEHQFQFTDPGTQGMAYYRIRQIRGRSETVSSPVKVGRSEPEAPRLAVLEGNFPNPFNPTTTIRFSLLETQEVSVSVWDLSGQLVSTLFSGTREAGDHAVSFSAGNLPSGTYFVRLESAEGLQSHPMLLMK